MKCSFCNTPTKYLRATAEKDKHGFPKVSCLKCWPAHRPQKTKGKTA